MKIPSFFRRRKGGLEEDDDFDDDDDDVEAEAPLARARETGGTTVIHDDDLEGDDDLDDDDDRDAGRALPPPSSPPAIAARPRGEDDDDVEDDDDGDEGDEDDEEGGGAHEGIPRGKLIAIAGGGTAALIVVVVLGAWLFLGGDPAPETPVAEPAKSDPKRVLVDLPPKAATPATPLRAPVGGEATAAPAGAATPAAGQPAAAPGQPGTLNAFASADRSLGAGIVVPPMTPAAFVGVPLSGGNQPLSPAPDPALVENGVEGPLPKKADDGRVAWQVYSRPPPTLPEGQKVDRRAKVAIILRGLGLSQAATEAAIRRLPGAVTLAFDSESPQVGDQAGLARRSGHEVLVQVPMESANFPEFDPGPNAVSTLLTPDDNVGKLNFHLSRMAGYVGILTTMGSAFTINEVQLMPVLEELQKRGLLYVDSYTTLNTLGPKLTRSLGVPSAYVDVVIDETLSRNAIDRKLADLVAKAKRQDAAIGIADPMPITLERIGTWANAIPKENADFVLVPVSAVVNIQPLP